MAGWDYIVGETGYDRPFVFFATGETVGFDATGITTLQMTILKADQTATAPAISDVAVVIDTVNPLRGKLAVNSGTPNVPQTPGSYLVQFKVTIGGEIRKTFELDLRVFNG